MSTDCFDIWPEKWTKQQKKCNKVADKRVGIFCYVPSSAIFPLLIDWSNAEWVTAGQDKPKSALNLEYNSSASVTDSSDGESDCCPLLPDSDGPADGTMR